MTVGPTVHSSAVHRFAASSQLAGPPTPLQDFHVFDFEPAGFPRVDVNHANHCPACAL
jgi:hypothetical protein